MYGDGPKYIYLCNFPYESRQWNFHLQTDFYVQAVWWLGLWAERPENRCSIPGVGRWASSWLVWRGGGLKRITHLNLVRVLRMRGSIPPLLPTLCLIKHRHNFTFIPDLLLRCLILVTILCIYWLVQINHRAYPEDGRSVHLRIIGIHLSGTIIWFCCLLATIFATNCRITANGILERTWRKWSLLNLRCCISCCPWSDWRKRQMSSSCIEGPWLDIQTHSLWNIKQEHQALDCKFGLIYWRNI
jgi:hypothetical protein